MAKRGTLAVDYLQIEALCDKRELSCTKFSLALGMSPEWLRQSKIRNAKITKERSVQIAAILGCDESEFIKADEPADPEQMKIEEPLVSEFEKEVYDFVKFAKSELAAQKSILMYLYNQSQQNVKESAAEDNQKAEEKPKPVLEKCMDLLESLLEGKGAVRYAEYMLKLDSECNIRDHRMADAAIAKLGHEKRTLGYGNNKTQWIGKVAYFKGLKGA